MLSQEEAELAHGDCAKGVWNLQKKANILEMPCKTGQGVETWTAWLVDQLAQGERPS